MHDVYVVMGLEPENATDTDTADGRPATIIRAKARLARVLGGDVETVSTEEIVSLARRAYEAQRQKIAEAAYQRLDCLSVDTVICSGSGGFLGRAVAVRPAGAAGAPRGGD